MGAIIINPNIITSDRVPFNDGVFNFGADGNRMNSVFMSGAIDYETTLTIDKNGVKKYEVNASDDLIGSHGTSIGFRDNGDSADLLIVTLDANDKAVFGGSNETILRAAGADQFEINSSGNLVSSTGTNTIGESLNRINTLYVDTIDANTYVGAPGGSGFPLANNAWATWSQSVSGTANVLKLDSNDNTILNALTAKKISLQVNETEILYVDADGLKATGNLTESLGDTSNNFSSVNTARLESNSSISIRAATGTQAIQFFHTGVQRFHYGESGSNRYLRPVNDNEVDLGYFGDRWRRVHGVQVQCATIVSNNSTDLTVSSNVTDGLLTLAGRNTTLSQSAIIEVYSATNATNPGDILLRTPTLIDADVVAELNGTTGSSFRVNQSSTDVLKINENGIIYGVTDTLVAANTSDGSDNSRLRLAGGGNSLQTRGAYIEISGNEFGPSPGDLTFVAGNVGGTIIFAEGGSNQYEMSGGQIKSLNNQVEICNSTTDGSDDGEALFGAGGDLGHTRGAYIHAYGNDHATQAGNIYILSGSEDANSSIWFSTNGTTRWRILNGGTLIPFLNNSYNIGLTSTHVNNMYVKAIGSGDASNNFDILLNNSLAWRFQVNGGHFLPLANNSYDIGTPSSAIQDLHYAGTLNNTSDARLKENVVRINSGDALRSICLLDPVRFNYKESYKKDHKTTAGFLAQDVVPFIPESVKRGDNNYNAQYGDKDFKTWQMDTTKMIPFLVGAIQELSAKIEALEAVH